MIYKRKRILAKKYLIDTLEKYNLAENLKGSWYANEFHLGNEGNVSYSDVDILAIGMHDTQRKGLMQSISYDMSEYFDSKLSVSIHNRDSLYQMNILDAQILGIAEYISQLLSLRDKQSTKKDYIDAKFTLLLLRNSPKERYNEVAKRIGTVESTRAYLVKVGMEGSFPIAYAKSLIMEFGNANAIQFYNQCLLEHPNESVVQATLSQLARCQSINKWLKGYLVSKVNQHQFA